MITANTTLDVLFDQACASAKDLMSEEVFIVRDLFRGFEWNRIPKGLRTKLGAMFFEHAQKAAYGEFAILDKTPQNQQRYKKI